MGAVTGWTGFRVARRIYQGDGCWAITVDELQHLDGTVTVNGDRLPVVEIDRCDEWALVRVGDHTAPYRERADRDLQRGRVTTA